MQADTYGRDILTLRAPRMSAIGELTGFLTRESTASWNTQPNGRSGEALSQAATAL